MLRQVGLEDDGPRGVAADVPPDRRHHRRRVARRRASSPPTCRSSTRASRASARRVRVFINQDVLEPILRAPRGRARRDRAQPHRGDGARAGRRRRDGHAARPGARRGAHGPRPLRGRRRRQPQPDPRAARHRHGGPRRALAQHHDLLPRRLRAAARGPQPGRHLRPQPRAARLLPARPGRQDGLPGHQHASARTSRRPEAVNVSEGITDERARELLRTAIGTPDIAGRDPRRSSHWRAEANFADPHAATGACSWPATPRTSCRPTAATAATPASWTRATSRGSSPRSSRARPGPRCSTPTTPSAARSSRLTVEQAYTRYATRVVPERGTDDARAVHRRPDDGARAGRCARGGDRRTERRRRAAPPAAETRGRPGTRAPHVALGAGPLDARPVRPRASSCCAPAGRRRLGAARRRGARRSMPTGSRRPTASRREGAALVRPDGIVAWRSVGAFDRDAVDRALASVLARTG